MSLACAMEVNIGTVISRVPKNIDKEHGRPRNMRMTAPNLY
jgi:hypothetical protein